MALIAAISLILGGCGVFFDEEQTRIPGERISVLSLERQLEPDRRIADLERLLGKQTAELDFFARAFRALNLAIPGPDAPTASTSTRPSSRFAPKAPSVSNTPASSEE